MTTWKKWLTGVLAGVSGLVSSGTASAELAVSTTELPGATELVAYETALEATGGVEPYSWTAIGEGYEEMSRGSTFVSSGVPQRWTEDDSSWELELPFAFPFYGQTYGSCWVSDNGTISFGESFSQYWYDQDSFLAHPLLAAMWADLAGTGMDIWVESRSDSVTIRWMSAYYGDDGDVNFSATFYPNGTITLSYGEGNAYGGRVGISAGDGQTALYSAISGLGSLENADDIVFKPRGLPDGVELTEAGVLRGAAQEPGSYQFTAVVEDAAGATASQPLALEVAENPAVRPALVSTSPRQGYVNLKTATSKKFSAAATHPAGGALSYAWSVDGAAVAGTKTNYTYRRTDTEMHTVWCTVSASDLPRTVAAEWQVGVLTMDGPEDVTVSAGQRVVLRADVTSSTPAAVTWYDGEGNEVGEGDSLVLTNMQATASYHAVATSVLGTVTGRTATVTVTTAPSVGRIYKLTGAPFAGNRLVLRAKAYGDLEGAAWSWKRDGVEVATTERLDIASLGEGDFGTYTLTVTTPLGTATSGDFTVAEAPRGVAVEWGDAPEVPGGVTGVVQMDGGNGFDVALLEDGTVAAWGQSTYWDCNVPEGLSGVSRVVAGPEVAFAVKTDGSVTGWGHGYYTDLVENIPENLADVVKVAVGGDGAFALKADGSVVWWDASGEVEVPEEVSDVVDVVAGSSYALALKADGVVVGMGYYSTPVFSELTDIVALAVNTSWARREYALMGDGTIEHSESSFYGSYEIPESEAAYVTLAAGEWHALALDAVGNVQAWGDNWYGQTDVPESIQGAAVGIACGDYHSAALLADSDGDSVADVLEPRYGRDPTVWEPWEKVGLGGTVTVEGGVPSGAATVSLLDSEGEVVASADSDEDGVWRIEGVIPGVYSVAVSAEGAVDTVVDGYSLLDGAEVHTIDLALEPGQDATYAETVPHLWSQFEECTEFQVPADSKAYLDLWPVEPEADGTIDLGEVAGCVSEFDGSFLLPHEVTVRLPGTGAQIPAPAWVDGEEGLTVEANPHFTEETGSVRIVTEPAGAEVWVDYADKALGVTPLTVEGLSTQASHSHILLLKKDGYLRPRPIQFQATTGEMTEIEVPLAADTAPAMTVVVSSALPGMDIYVDYLPTGEVTPATVGGMDPASHAGALWYSASHSILLRHARLRPFAARAVPEGLEPEDITITAPNTYDDSDGDGIRNDKEVEAGEDPFDSGSDAEVTIHTPVPVPHSWLDAHPAALAAAGGDYEAAALADYDGDGMEDWKEYVAGTDPENSEEFFRVTELKFENGKWLVVCDPRDETTRSYQLEAATSADGEYVPVPDGAEAVPGQRFYRVGVSLK